MYGEFHEKKDREMHSRAHYILYIYEHISLGNSDQT